MTNIDKTKEELIKELHQLQKENESLKVLFNKEITELKQVEEALRKSDKQYRLITEKISDVVWLMDLKGKSLFVSPSVEKFTGYSVEEYLAQTIKDRFTSASASVAMEAFRNEVFKYARSEAHLKDYKKIMVFDYICKNGSIKTGEITVTPYFDEDNICIGLHGVTRDITNSTIAEKALRESLEKLTFNNVILHTQQESSLDGILVVDENGKILSFNQRFVRMWGISNETMESKSDKLALQSITDKLINPDEFLLKVKSLYNEREERSRDEIALKDGRIFDRYSAPMNGTDGKYYGRVWYFKNITNGTKKDGEV